MRAHLNQSFNYTFTEPNISEARRSMDVAHFNEIANDPTVRPSLGGEGPIELAPVVDDVNNYAFASEHGGFILWRLGSGRYDVHSLFLPDGRGDEARSLLDLVAAYMFARTDCTEGRTMIPEHNRPAKILAQAGGFEKRFELERLPWTPGHTKRAECHALTIERWALTHALPLRVGEWFHEKIEQAKQLSCSTSPVHEEEAAHTRIAGATTMMIHGGQPEKAVAFYNVWALQTRYQPITLLSKNPAVVDIGDAVLESSATHVEILKCR